MGSFHRSPPAQGAGRAVLRSPVPCLQPPGPAQSAPALGGQGLWKLLEMLTRLPWIRECESGELGRGREERLAVYLLSQPPCLWTAPPPAPPASSTARSQPCVPGGALRHPDSHPLDARCFPAPQL